MKLDRRNKDLNLRGFFFILLLRCNCDSEILEEENLWLLHFYGEKKARLCVKDLIFI